MNNVWILAQAEGNEAPVPITQQKTTSGEQAGTKVPSDPNDVTGQKDRPTLFPPWLFIPLVIVMVFMLFRGPQKQKQQRKKMVQSLKKNDRVQTIGGIFGTVMDIKDDEITLKIDESNNTKIKVTSSAIGRNLSRNDLRA